MSEIKVNKISPRTACGTTTLGDSGDTINIPAGVTISNNGTATGFGGTGVVSWDTTPKTVDFTAVTGTGYFVDTATTGAVDVTLPLSPSAGDVVAVSDYAKNFNTANCTLLRNGSNIGGTAFNSTISTDGVAVTLVYVDATKGWIVTDSGNQSDAPTVLYVTATGGCISTCGNFKVHTFLSPGTFTVTCAGNPGGSSVVDYLVVAGGGGGGGALGGGGGAGGFRLSNDTCMSAPITSPLANPTGLSLPAAPYAITVGAAGAAGEGSTCTQGGQGGTSSIGSSIISAGGGGGRTPASGVGNDGGSGGGGVGSVTGALPTAYAGGAGNTPATPIAQGTPGGKGADGVLYATAGGGGGGAACAGGDSLLPGASNTPGFAGIGGAGSYVAQTGFAGCNGTTGPVPNARYFSGGGGGAINSVPGGPGAGGAPGVGGGGQGFGQPGNPGGGQAATAGGTNTGGGGGSAPDPGVPRAGGSGIVIIRYKYQ